MAERKLTPLKTLLPLAMADRIVDAALEAAGAHALLPLTVAVLDVGGNLIALKRQDGSGVVRTDIAVAKAYAALGMGMSSRIIRDRFADRVGFQAGLAAASDGRFIAAPGGVLVLDDAGDAIGAVGISGDASDKDEYCAIEGIRAAGLTCEPATAAANWQDAKL
jgi:uncharacterized protein GlcG (DUF336 family)